MSINDNKIDIESRFPTRGIELSSFDENDSSNVIEFNNIYQNTNKGYIIYTWVVDYFKCYKGNKFIGSPNIAHWSLMATSFIASFIAIITLGALQKYLFLPVLDKPAVIGSWGAACVVLFGAPGSYLAQPRNLIFGNIIAALIGTSCFKIFGANLMWIGGAFAVSVSILIMHLTKTLHPPAGATALLAVVGGSAINQEGY